MSRSQSLGVYSVQCYGYKLNTKSWMIWWYNIDLVITFITIYFPYCCLYKSSYSLFGRRPPLQQVWSSRTLIWQGWWKMITLELLCSWKGSSEARIECVDIYRKSGMWEGRCQDGPGTLKASNFTPLFDYLLRDSCQRTARAAPAQAATATQSPREKRQLPRR